jgi:succinate-acetate transporter protein
MATTSETRPHGLSNGSAAEYDRWRASTRVFLQPIAAPSILGLFGFAAATFMVSLNVAGVFGTPLSGIYLFPFAAAFGGVAQFMAGMWSYRARDAVATAMHGMWGSFWIAYGILWLLVATHDMVLPKTYFPALGFWFYPLAVITGFGFLATVGRNLGLAATLGTLAAGSALLAVGYNGDGTLTAGGWVLFASAICACYTAGAMMLKASYGRVVLPLGETETMEQNIPGGAPTHPIEYHWGEPGVRQGQ